MIEAKSIGKFFSVINEKGLAEGFTAVLNVSLTIPDGKIVSILGPSGCGKSTFLEILAGLQAPTGGTIHIDGKLVLEPLPATRKEQIACRRRYRFISPLANGVFRDRPKHDIMDEPFAAVDALTREKLQDELLRLLEETGKTGGTGAAPITVILVTHDTQEAVYLSDEVIVFSPGPGTIRNRIPVSVKRPRARTDAELTEIQERILAMFQYDINQEADYSI